MKVVPEATAAKNGKEEGRFRRCQFFIQGESEEGPKPQSGNFTGETGKEEGNEALFGETSRLLQRNGGEQGGFF